MTIVIVGLGQLGSDVAGRLVARGEDVVGVKRTAPTTPTPVVENAPGRFTLQLCDLTTMSPELPTDTAAIVVALAPHQRSVEAYDGLYRDGVAHLLAAVAELPGIPPRILFVSSTAVWGEDGGERIDDTTPAVPTTGTARALVAAEEAVSAAVPEASLIRFGGLYGPTSTMFVDQVRDGRVTRPSGWTNRIHRDDAAAVILHLLDLPATALPPVVAGIDEEPVLLSTAADFIAERLGVAPPVLDDAGRTPEESRRGKRIVADALRDSGFSYRYPTYREGYAAQLP
ncbi:sugar nucleotide-binding protein [Plantibacter sp. VKM Ac-2880]|uniref:NAD-dependent epimerase/dehydratase family protein n=1 Tax=Plantibacter sp. VKM Ac-2880 TaxID=2783827 RepID=UPI0018907C6F|nr:NAD-dependent epimerase/dehydratase family protein [Plantibacter sp. VKM Ac-2880]MBF4570666.1 sugar nucleotide-binding protein [Plantibacter sp. VKM Ac-2880]